jgi:DNA-directed RNA polymerase specialized sigma24 family protein
MQDIGNSFLEFCESRQSDLRRIARQSREFCFDDMQSEAWLIAERIALRRGRAVDFADIADQETVLSWLYRELVTFAEKAVRFAVRLDKDWDSEDSAGNLLDRLLAAPAHFDPLARMLDEQVQRDVLEAIQVSYSQTAAYVILLDRFAWDMDELAEHLKVVLGTLRNRITRSCGHMKIQPSLFDGVESIAADFQPTHGRIPSCMSQVAGAAPTQLAWDFC